MLLYIRDFRENRRREGRTFSMGVREITFTLLPQKYMTFESKERLGKVCVLRHGVERLHCTVPLTFAADFSNVAQCICLLFIATAL
jgi:hypothetical protein